MFSPENMVIVHAYVGLPEGNDTVDACKILQKLGTMKGTYETL